MSGIIGAIILLVIVLKTVEKGGGLFDFLEADARYENWKTNVEFNCVIGFLCLLVFGGGAWLIVQAMKSDDGVAFSRPTVTHIKHSHTTKSHSDRHTGHK